MLVLIALYNIAVVPKLKIFPVLKLGKPNLKFQVWAPILKMGRFQVWAAGPSCPNLKFFSILRNIDVLNLKH